MAIIKSVEIPPALRALRAVQGTTGFVPDTTEQWDFGTCSFRAETTSERCQLPVKAPRDKKARALFDKLSLMEDCPMTEDFLAELKSLVEDLHCKRWHKKKAVKKFQDWKKNPTGIDSESDHSCASSDSDEQAVSDAESDGSVHIVEVQEKSSRMRYARSARRVSTVSFEEGDDSPASFSTPERPRATSDPSSEHDSGIFMESVSKDVTTTTVTGTGENTEAISFTETQIVEGFGTVTTPERKGSNRDQSHFYKMLHKPLTKIEQDLGIVYVLEHTTAKGFYKIGWSKISAAARLKTNRCCKSTSTIIRETNGARFFAAHRAEKLAQLVLREYNIRVSGCPTCGKSHKEWFWFQASREQILYTVEAMERIVKMPAYKKVEDKWKLTDAAHEVFKQTAVVDMARAWLFTQKTAVSVTDGGTPNQIDTESVRVEVARESRISANTITPSKGAGKKTVVVLDPPSPESEIDATGKKQKEREEARVGEKSEKAESDIETIVTKMLRALMPERFDGENGQAGGHAKAQSGSPQFVAQTININKIVIGYSDERKSGSVKVGRHDTRSVAKVLFPPKESKT